MFSGYFHDFASKFSDKNTVYALEAGWTASAWNYTYNYIFPVAHKSTLITQDEAKYKHFMVQPLFKSRSHAPYN